MNNLMHVFRVIHSRRLDHLQSKINKKLGFWNHDPIFYNLIDKGNLYIPSTCVTSSNVKLWNLINEIRAQFCQSLTFSALFMCQNELVLKGVSHWAANACERSKIWIRKLFVRVRKRLQTCSQTVFIVTKSFSCCNEILNMFNISLRIYFSANSCKRLQTVVSVAKQS